MPKRATISQFETMTAESASRASVPAWLMSLVLHFLLLILLALGMRTTANSTVEEPTRRIGIVLAQCDDEQQFAYLDDSPTPPPDTGQDHQESPQVSALESSTSAEIGGPPVPSTLLIPEIQLPGAAVPIGTPDGLLAHSLHIHAGGRQPILPGVDDEAILAEEAALKAARRALGPMTTVSLFESASAEGRSFAFAIDRSKSMGGSGLNALSAAGAELSRALAHLSPKHRFQILACHHSCVYYKTPRLIPATDENKSGVSDFLDHLGAFGSTDHEMALRASLAMEPDVIFLLTDGGDPHLNDVQLANLRKLARGRTSIHCIQFGFGELTDETNFMMRLAQQNGGGYTYVNMSRRRSE